MQNTAHALTKQNFKGIARVGFFVVQECMFFKVKKAELLELCHSGMFFIFIFEETASTLP
jgi:hypothetical protein